jgi:general L-amino acid transport system permease protein
VQQQRPPPWRDVRVLRVALQAGFLAVVVLVLWWVFGNLRANLQTLGLSTGFGFLDQPTGFRITDSDLSPGAPVREALLVGLGNTLRVSLVGIALATVLGIVLGVSRLSTNWLVRTGARLYVEFFRNVPVLVIIIFMYSAVFLRLPGITQAVEWLGVLVLSNRGVWVPWGEPSGAAATFLILVGVALLIGIVVAMWGRRRFDATGEPSHAFLWSAATFVAVVALAYVVLSAPVTLSLPSREGRVVTGGFGVSVLYAALLGGLVIYTASHIAEIVRGSILAVPKGQTEAATALALSGFQRMWYVVLPQAFRIIIPPLSNQYLNLAKNSSLGVAIGYVELTRVTRTVIGNGNPAPQGIATNMLAYLVVSLAIAFVANMINRGLRLESR